MGLELIKYSDRIWYLEFEDEKDRPCLGYVRGDRFSIAVDAGHSDAHIEEFYKALKAEGLPLPDLTVITHWHWDHAFAMYKINGLSVANERTNDHLLEFADMIAAEGVEKFLDIDLTIQKEYAGGRPVVIVPADIVFEDKLILDLGGITAQLFTSVSPHTDDTTLVLIPEEKFLFYGDCVCGVFPTWEKDPVKTAALVKTLESIDADTCLGGHWRLMTKGDLLKGLEEDIFF